MKIDDRSHASNPALAQLQQKLRFDMNDIADNMSTGSCANYADYRELVGRITGLAAAERHLLDLDCLIDLDE